jgi:hypothetical protein
MKYIEFIEKFINRKLRYVQTGLICKIEKFDAAKWRADVKPLMKYKNAYGVETEYPVLINIPVVVQKQGDYFIKPNYVNGDLVWVGFSAFDIENPAQEYTRVESTKIHELHNACVLGAIVKENYSATTAQKESGVVIGKSSGTVEPAIKGDTFLDAFNTFLDTVSQIVPGSVAQNATALTAIKTAATVLKGQIETFKSQDVKIT